MTKSIKALLAVSLLAFAGSVAAVPITGTIGFTGAYSHDGTNLSDATTLTILSAQVQGSTTGDFAAAGIVNGDVPTFYTPTIVFNPVGGINPLWSIDSFVFVLNTMHVDFQSATSLVLSGIGTVSDTSLSLDDADLNWVLSANQAGANLTWSSSLANVPEPGIALLLGVGLVGLSVSRKLRKAA